MGGKLERPRFETRPVQQVVEELCGVSSRLPGLTESRRRRCPRENSEEAWA